MGATILAELGKGSANRFSALAVINGKGVVSYGDASNSASANLNLAAVGILWGWDSGGSRLIPLWNYSMTGLLPRKVQVARAYVRLYPTGKNVAGGYVYPGWDVALYEVEPALDSGIDFRESAASVAWLGDYGPRAGYDFDATPVGSTTIPSALFAALGTDVSGTTAGSYVDVDVTAAVQHALDQKRPLRLVMPVPFATSGGGAGTQIGFLNPELAVNGTHTYLVVEYWPAIGVLEASTTESGRPADFSRLHNPAAAGTGNRTWLDAIEQGSTGPTHKYWAWNFRTAGPRNHVILGTSRAECDPIDNTASVSGETLRYIYAYDRDDTASPDTYAPEGRLQVEVQSGGATYKLAYTAPGAAATYLLEETTGLSTVDMAADHIFEYNSKRAFKIFTRDWSATTGFNVADRFTTNCRPDARTTQSTETLGLVEVMPPTPSRFSDAGDTAKARKLSGAYTQQLWAAAADVDISGTTHTHVEVRNTSETNWLTGSPVTLVSEDGATVVESTIETVYSSTHGTYPQQIRLSTQLSAPQLAAMTATASITGGLYLGTFAANLVRSLSAATLVGDQEIELVTAFDGLPGSVQIVDSVLGYSQIVAVVSGSTTLTLAETLDYAFSAGSFVFAIINSGTNPAAMAGAPYFVQGDLPADQEEGLYQGYYRFFERRTVG